MCGPALESFSNPDTLFMLVLEENTLRYSLIADGSADCGWNSHKREAKAQGPHGAHFAVHKDATISTCTTTIEYYFYRRSGHAPLLVLTVCRSYEK